MATVTIPDSVLDELLNLVEEDEDVGVCFACFAINWGIEQDGRHGTCDECGKPRVFGALVALGLA